MWRDRTNLYISYRSSYSRPFKRPRFTSTHDEETEGFLSPSSSDEIHIELSSLPPTWTSTQDEIDSLLSNIRAKSAVLDKLHAKHVLPGFDDNRAAEEGEIERLTTEITAGFHKCQSAIRRMEGMGGKGTKEEERMRGNVRMALAQKVQEVSGEFRRKQSAYLKKLRGLSSLSAPLDPSTTRSTSPLPGSTFPTTEEDDINYSQSTLQRSAILTSNDTAIAQREREITDIAKGIIELADIFKELQTMVIDQGTLLDRIDYNIERMNVSVKEAEKELNVAVNYQRRYTKRKIILLLILIIVGVIILLTLKPASKSNDNSSPPPKEAPPAPPPPDPVADGNVKPPGEGVPPTVEKAADVIRPDKGVIPEPKVEQPWRVRRGRGRGRRLVI